MQSSCHRSEAVGGARSSRDNRISRSQSLVVNVVNDGRQIVACRSRDNNLLCASLDMCRSFSLAGIETCALENYVDTQFAPRQLSCVRLSVDSDLLAVNGDRTRSNDSLAVLSKNSVLVSYSVLTLTELAGETALSGIVLQQVSLHLRAGQVVDSNNLITLSLKHLTESQTTNTAKAVNSYFCHNSVLVFFVFYCYCFLLP